jgi:hypothetical protein
MVHTYQLYTRRQFYYTEAWYLPNSSDKLQKGQHGSLVLLPKTAARWQKNSTEARCLVLLTYLTALLNGRKNSSVACCFTKFQKGQHGSMVNA